MIVLLLSLLAGAAGVDGPRDVETVRAAALPGPDARYPGSFDRPPAEQWTRRLPGKPVNAPSHAERARPILDGPHIYVGSAGGDSLYVLSRASGALVDAYPASGPVNAEPLLTAERIYFTDTLGTTWAYTRGGELLWSREGTAPRPTRPTLDDGRLFVRDVDDLLVALDADTGEQLWQYRRRKDPTRQSELTLYAAPMVAVSAGIAVAGFSDGSLVALDAASGDVKWDLSLGEGRYPDLVAPAVVEGGMVFASGYLGPLVALDLETSTLRWRVDAGSAAAATMVDTREGRLLLHPGTDGTLRAIDPTAGDVRWSWDSGRGAALTRPVITEAGVLIGGAVGSLALIDATTGEEQWRWHGDVFLEGLSSAPSVDGRQAAFTTNAGNLRTLISPRRSSRKPMDRRPAGEFELVYPKRDGLGRDR